jgi:sulfide dehydrogenase [flavocytochrome c] flavoprotein subunit
MKISRRKLLGGLGTLVAAPTILRAQTSAHVVILGGGFGGASMARALRRANPEIRVTLIERDSRYHTCPFSNGVLGGLWSMGDISFGYDALTGAGIEVVHGEATEIDPDQKTIVMADGARITGDVLVLAPGIQYDWTAIEGLSPETAEVMPAAWKAGPETQILRDQLVAMQDGGVVVIGIPAPPFRCPPGPYERISLIAHYLKQEKPASKIMVLDAQDNFSKQPLFEEAWENLYPGMVERVPGSMAGAVRSVDVSAMRVSTDFDDVTAAVANIIPPQRAAQILIDAGLDEGLGWCPVDPVDFQSRVAPDVYILGDAALAGDMPKSGFSANMQAKICALAILNKLEGRSTEASKLINVCYSLAAPDYGFSVADVFSQGPEKVALVESQGRTTAVGAPASIHAAEAEYAKSWYATITSEMFA